jgi:hypothetical protein
MTFWDCTYVYIGFGGACCIHFNPEDRGNRLHRNVDVYLPNYMFVFSTVRTNHNLNVNVICIETLRAEMQN